MKQTLGAVLLTTTCFLITAGAASAQVKCTEGKSLNGDCVNPILADKMRESAIIFSQPELSHTAFPILPSGDRFYRYPNQLIPNPLKPAPAFTFSP